MASLAGAWVAMVAGFGGLRDHGGELTLDPALPGGITKLAFSIRWRGVRLQVRVDHEQVVYAMHDGDEGEVNFHHDGEEVTVTPGKPVTRKMKHRQSMLPQPPQPLGRAPMSRHEQHAS
jgi:trehalose/maltose hydrolase-like predicted phosphorylase